MGAGISVDGGNSTGFPSFVLISPSIERFKTKVKPGSVYDPSLDVYLRLVLLVLGL